MTSSEVVNQNAIDVPTAVETGVILKKYKRGNTTKDRLKMILAEGMAGSILAFFGCMGVIDWGGGVTIAAYFNFGLTVMFIDQIFEHISYSIINPAVAVAAVVFGKIDAKLGFMYVCAQTTGTVLGYGALKALTPDEFFNTPEGSPGLCVTTPHPTMSYFRIYCIEFLITFTLVMIICGYWDPRNGEESDSGPIKIGLAIAALCLAAGPKTGPSMNPALSFAPALWNWEWDYHWIFWCGPLSGGLVASLFYKYIFYPRNTAKDK